MLETPEARFWAKVEPVPFSGCWVWMGHINDKGYGLTQIRIGHKWKKLRAHRVAYELYRGPIPAGLDLDHKCRVRCCVNPDHLEPVTRQVNILRGIGIPAIKAAQTHCVRGHEFTPKNTGRTSKQTRYCRLCKRDEMRRRRDLAGIKKSSARRRGEVD